MVNKIHFYVTRLISDKSKVKKRFNFTLLLMALCCFLVQMSVALAEAEVSGLRALHSGLVARYASDLARCKNATKELYEKNRDGFKDQLQKYIDLRSKLTMAKLLHAFKLLQNTDGDVGDLLLNQYVSALREFKEGNGTASARDRAREVINYFNLMAQTDPSRRPVNIDFAKLLNGFNQINWTQFKPKPRATPTSTATPSQGRVPSSIGRPRVPLLMGNKFNIQDRYILDQLAVMKGGQNVSSGELFNRLSELVHRANHKTLPPGELSSFVNSNKEQLQGQINSWTNDLETFQNTMLTKIKNHLKNNCQFTTSATDESDTDACQFYNIIPACDGFEDTDQCALNRFLYFLGPENLGPLSNFGQVAEKILGGVQYEHEFHLGNVDTSDPSKVVINFGLKNNGGEVVRDMPEGHKIILRSMRRIPGLSGEKSPQKEGEAFVYEITSTAAITIPRDDAAPFDVKLSFEKNGTPTQLKGTTSGTEHVIKVEKNATIKIEIESETTDQAVVKATLQDAEGKAATLAKGEKILWAASGEILAGNKSVENTSISMTIPKQASENTVNAKWKNATGQEKASSNELKILSKGKAPATYDAKMVLQGDVSHSKSKARITLALKLEDKEVDLWPRGYTATLSSPHEISGWNKKGDRWEKTGVTTDQVRNIPRKDDQSYEIKATLVDGSGKELKQVANLAIRAKNESDSDGKNDPDSIELKKVKMYDKKYNLEAIPKSKNGKEVKLPSKWKVKWKFENKDKKKHSLHNKLTRKLRANYVKREAGEDYDVFVSLFNADGVFVADDVFTVRAQGYEEREDSFYNGVNPEDHIRPNDGGNILIVDPDTMQFPVPEYPPGPAAFTPWIPLGGAIW